MRQRRLNELAEGDARFHDASPPGGIDLEDAVQPRHIHGTTGEAAVAGERHEVMHSPLLDVHRLATTGTRTQLRGDVGDDPVVCIVDPLRDARGDILPQRLPSAHARFPRLLMAATVPDQARGIRGRRRACRRTGTSTSTPSSV